MAMGSWHWAVVVFVAAGAVTAQAADPPRKAPAKKVNKELKAYLTDEGLLRSPLEVRDEEGGFGTFAGKIYRVEPDGSWTVTNILRRKPAVQSQGQLTKDQIVELAEALKRFDLENLPSAGRPKVNPHTLTITFAGVNAVLTIGVDRRANPPTRDDPAPDVAGRFGGIVSAVRGLLQSPTPPAASY
jgi:hypothetical protein